MKRLLVTGGLGFIGFNFIQSLEGSNDWKVVGVVDKITVAAFQWLPEKAQYLEEHNIPLIKKDIRDLVDDDVAGTDIIVNFAAESHVDNSIKAPLVFTESNVLGVANLLELCRKNHLRLHQVSTDEVYGSVDPEKDFVDENFMLNPSSPYSASKTSADLLVLSYWKTFGTDVTISRCSNNFGPYQNTEKFIPMIISTAMDQKKIPVYGDGLQKRFWIHVDEHNDAIRRILEFGRPGEIYNIAPNPKNLRTNISIVNDILAIMGLDSELVSHVSDRPGHDKCYYLEGQKIMNECGFVPSSSTTFDFDLKDTVNWYMVNLQNMKAFGQRTLDLKNLGESHII